MSGHFEKGAWIKDPPPSVDEAMIFLYKEEIISFSRSGEVLASGPHISDDPRVIQETIDRLGNGGKIRFGKGEFNFDVRALLEEY